MHAVSGVGVVFGQLTISISGYSAHTVTSSPKYISNSEAIRHVNPSTINTKNPKDATRQ